MHQIDNLTYEFGPYRLNLAQRSLTRDGETVALSPKATEILVRLVVNAGHVVEKDDLLRDVWPDTFVEESNLTQNIFVLRRALGDERTGPKYIETVAKRGYRFVASVKVYESDEATTDDEAEAAAATGEGEAPPERIVVAVMPFINATGNEGLEYLAEGLTDNIINNLSRVSRLRVMSRTAVFRYNADEVDPRAIGKQLNAKAVLVGKIQLRPALATAGTQSQSSVITAELVEVATGWQLWGESFDCADADLLQIQDAITRQLLLNLKLKLSGEEEKHVTARYTENPGAYQAYLEGRYHWSRYTRAGIEKAIGHFREAIEQDPNYALAYAAIVDCYLRLATNYLPPADSAAAESDISDPFASDLSLVPEFERKVKLRFEWDWKSAERELRRASELKVSYPAAHQWYAAYRYAQQLLERPAPFVANPRHSAGKNLTLSPLNHIASLHLTRNEQVQVFCGVAREQIEAGNYDAACKILQSFWRFGDWPELSNLNQESAADLLFTAGELAGCVASTRQVPKGQKFGEALLSGSIAIFEHLSCTRCAAEARIELALCYYRQGLFELGRSTLVTALDTLATDDYELRSLALIRLASLERHAGRVQDALAYLKKAKVLVEAAGPWVSGRCQLELAATYQDLALLEGPLHFENAKAFCLTALEEFEAVGNHRLAAIIQNNLGFLLSLMGEFSIAELNLLKARGAFTHFSDRIRLAQVDDSLAQLYLAQGRFSEAQSAIEQSIRTIELGDEDAILAGSLTTGGRIYTALKRYYEARNAFQSAYNLARRCGDIEGAGRAIVLLCEGMREVLEPEELLRVRKCLLDLLSNSQLTATKARVMRCLKLIDSAPEP